MKIEKIQKYKFQILMILFLSLVIYDVCRIVKNNTYEEMYLYYADKQEFQDSMKNDIEVLNSIDLKYRIKTKIKMTATDEVPLTVLVVRKKDYDKAYLHTTVNRLAPK